jgi:hypothetical protein
MQAIQTADCGHGAAGRTRLTRAGHSRLTRAGCTRLTRARGAGVR